MQGKPVFSGEKYDKNALTAAHRTLPIGTMVKVTNLKNNKSVVVKINDRGPHGSKARIIDLSGRAAQELDMIKDGTAKVRLEVLPQ
jgi:rare lipoprotein A